MNTIVVGVDGSEGARRALDWALEEARLRSAAVRVLHAITPMVAPTPMVGPAGGYAGATQEQQQEAGERLLDDMLQHAGNGVALERGVVVAESPARALVDASSEADLLVVGARGIGGFGRLLLGSVSHQCVSHASCPVTVVPSGED